MEPASLLMVAMAAFDEVQVAEAVRSPVVPSLYVPVAVNCIVPPGAIVGFAGVTTMRISDLGVPHVAIVPEVWMTQLLWGEGQFGLAEHWFVNCTPDGSC